MGLIFEWGYQKCDGGVLDFKLLCGHGFKWADYIRHEALEDGG